LKDIFTIFNLEAGKDKVSVFTVNEPSSCIGTLMFLHFQSQVSQILVGTFLKYICIKIVYYTYVLLLVYSNVDEKCISVISIANCLYLLKGAPPDGHDQQLG